MDEYGFPGGSVLLLCKSGKPASNVLSVGLCMSFWRDMLATLSI
jgi:hypothetical protein